MAVHIRFLTQRFFESCGLDWGRVLGGLGAGGIVLFIEIPIMRSLFTPLWTNENLKGGEGSWAESDGRMDPRKWGLGNI